MPYDPDRHGPKRIVGPGFHAQVYEIVSEVPRGSVTTYGDVARVLGSVGVARHVGFALAALRGERDDVPWFRVVDGRGRVHTSPEEIGGTEQRDRLRSEGIEVDEKGRVARFVDVRHVFED